MDALAIGVDCVTLQAEHFAMNSIRVFHSKLDITYLLELSTHNGPQMFILTPEGRLKLGYSYLAKKTKKNCLNAISLYLSASKFASLL